MTIDVKTESYQWAHGHLPRGNGYWAFEIGGEIFWAKGLYSKAKAEAVKAAKVAGVWTIKVLS